MRKSMLSVSKRLVALALALVTVFGLVGMVMPVKADAATTAQGQISSVKVNTSGYYKAKGNTNLRTGTKWYSGSYATVKKDAVIQTNGSSGSYYKVSLDGTTYYVKKADLKQASKTTAATLYYTKSSAALRKAPDQNAGKVTLPAGTLCPVIGQVVHKNNLWYVVNYNGSQRFIFSGNVQKASKVTLKITGEDKVAVGENIQLKYTTNPSCVPATWSTSNSSVATVDISGKVKGVAPGTAQITASVGGYLTVSFPVTVYEYAVFPNKQMYFTQIAFESYSHSKQNAVDLWSNYRFFAPFTGKITSINRSWGYVVLESVEKVRYADGSFDYMTIGFLHDAKVSDLKVGQIIKQGTPFYDQGGMANGNPKAYGAHVHLSIWRGKHSGKPMGAGDTFIYDALYIDRNLTTKISNYGSYNSKNRVTGSAPKYYKSLWRYLH